MIHFDNVTLRYGGHTALRELSAGTEPGRLYAVTGPSGAGKTSLLWLAAGLLRPQRGEVRCGDSRLSHRAQAINAGIVLVPQGNGLASMLTARENVMAGLLAAGVDPSEAADRALDVLGQLDLADQAEQLAEELSGGQSQRVAVARGAALRGEVLLADEITSDLDADNRDRVIALLRAEAGRGACVLFATNDDEVAERCDVRLDLQDGVLLS